MSEVKSRLLSISSQLTANESHIQFNKNTNFPKLLLNRPKALNSLSLKMIRDIATILPEVENYPAYWIEGAGGKAFCAGGDVKVLFEESGTVEAREQFFKEEFILDYRLATTKSIQVANWDGIVMGGGVGLTHFAPFRIATERTLLAMPEAKIGFFTDVGVGSTLANLRNNIGMYLGLTSNRLKGEEVFLSGFANYFIASADISKVYEEINQELKESSNPTKTIEKVLNKYHQGDKTKKIENENEIGHIFSGESVLEIYERAKTSETNFGKSIVKILESICPLSVHVIFKLIRESKNMDKKTIFKRDFIIVQNIVGNKNFEAGVTSLLITKDNTPKWTHKALVEVTESERDSLFDSNPNRSGLEI